MKFKRAEKKRRKREKDRKNKKAKSPEPDYPSDAENDPSNNWLKAGGRRKRTVKLKFLYFDKFISLLIVISQRG